VPHVSLIRWGGVLGATLFLASMVPAAPFDKTFWDHWGDGKAEVSGYELTFPRYGELRQGTAVLIFVTEPFSDSKRVKADPGKNPKSDEFQVMKLNVVRDFPTGVYDYNLMTSVFLGLEPFGGKGLRGQQAAGTPAKISFSAQEWCGQVYEQALFRKDSVNTLWHSYFDGEADGNSQLPFPEKGASEDALFLWARGWANPRLNPGETRDVPLLLSLVTSRLNHTPLVWKNTKLSRGLTSESIKVPAGTFAAEVWTAETEGGPAWTFHVEAVAPHRILKWTTSEGEQGLLKKSERLPYWKRNGSQWNSRIEE
jgi:hypothetical protein